MKTRFRVAQVGSWGAKKQVLILQIYKHFPPDYWRGMPDYLAHSKWVDAQPEDLLEGDIVEKSNEMS